MRYFIFGVNENVSIEFLKNHLGTEVVEINKQSIDKDTIEKLRFVTDSEGEE